MIEMTKLIVQDSSGNGDDQEFEVIDATARDRITNLESTSGHGLGVRIRGISGAYSYGHGDYDAAYTIVSAILNKGTPYLSSMGNIIYQKSLSTEAYLLKSCRKAGTAVYVTFTNDLALVLDIGGTITEQEQEQE